MYRDENKVYEKGIEMKIRMNLECQISFFSDFVAKFHEFLLLKINRE